MDKETRYKAQGTAYKEQGTSNGQWGIDNKQRSFLTGILYQVTGN